MKLYRFRSSPFARKIQMLLELMGRRHQVIEVSYSNRSELARSSGGYIYVPVLIDDEGRAIVESRAIAEHLLTGEAARRLTPEPLEGPIWAYADFCDGPLEDTIFRISSPLIRDAWKDPGDRALYVLIKERKFGAGCIDQWAASRDVLLRRARQLLAPTLRTLSRTPFVFGQDPTLADAALYGNLACLFEGDPELPRALDPALPAYMQRLEAARR